MTAAAWMTAETPAHAAWTMVGSPTSPTIDETLPDRYSDGRPTMSNTRTESRAARWRRTPTPTPPAPPISRTVTVPSLPGHFQVGSLGLGSRHGTRGPVRATFGREWRFVASRIADRQRRRLRRATVGCADAATDSGRGGRARSHSGERNPASTPRRRRPADGTGAVGTARDRQDDAGFGRQPGDATSLRRTVGGIGWSERGPCRHRPGTS